MTQERSTRVILCPNSTDRHIILLGRHLEKIGARVSYFEWFGGFAPYWMAKLALLRIQGNRVLSVHWTPFDSWTRMRIARILCRALGIKMVLTVHNLVPHDVRFGSESKDKEAMLFLSEWSDAIVVHSDVTKRDVENLYGQTEDKISVIPLASYTEMIKISENPDRARERLGLPMNKVLVFMLSPCRKDKGLNTY
ncbi:MAG TPA: glycosyltransferase, partial [Methanomassiliicoccales archaeon]|nr:glycosyltransferase [Methanomassiliicoccales archaeon]